MVSCAIQFLLCWGLGHLDLLCAGWFRDMFWAGLLADGGGYGCELFGVVRCRFLGAGLLPLVWWVGGFGFAVLSVV